jgi:hypothetical protein
MHFFGAEKRRYDEQLHESARLQRIEQVHHTNELEDSSYRCEKEKQPFAWHDHAREAEQSPRHRA